MLSLENVKVQIAGRTLLQVDDVQVEPGEVLGVVGPNGAGKSTMLKVCCGEWIPNRGSVSMNGRRLEEWGSRERSMARAVLPQSSSLTFAFRVIDVVLLGRSPYNSGLYDRNDREAAQEAMIMGDIQDLAERRYTDLSGGEKQRVHLARVLAQLWGQEHGQSRYLLLDEPTSALDLAHQHQTLSIVRRFARQQDVGVLVILHDLNLASLYADRLIMLKQGMIIANGAPGEVLRADTIEEVFSYPVTIRTHPEKAESPLVIVSPLTGC